MKIEDITKTRGAMDNSKRVILNMMYTASILTEKFTEVLKPYDLSGEQYNVLRILRGQEGNPANMCVIGERMVTKSSNTTRLIDKLLLKEMVTREVCPQNRRKIEVRITEKGLKILEELEPKITLHERNLASSLTDEELTELNRLLEKYRG